MMVSHKYLLYALFSTVQSSKGERKYGLRIKVIIEPRGYSPENGIGEIALKDPERITFHVLAVI